MAITGMEIGCSGRHRYGTIKAAAEADPLLLRKEQQRASRRRLLSVFAAIATMLVLCVLATQARKTPSMMTATITSTEGESPTEGAYNTGLQEPVANSNLLSFKAQAAPPSSNAPTSTAKAFSTGKGTSTTAKAFSTSKGTSTTATAFSASKDASTTTGKPSQLKTKPRDILAKFSSAGEKEDATTEEENQSSDDEGEGDPWFSLNLVATNEYGQFDALALSLYGIEMIGEPYKLTTITALCTEESERDDTVLFWYMIKFPDGYTIPEDEDEHGHEHEHDDEYEGGDGDGDKDRHEAPQKRHARRVLCEDDDEGEGEGEYEVVFYGVNGQSVDLTCTEPGSWYYLAVAEIADDNTDINDTDNWDIVAVGEKIIACKYVRRELRDLTTADKNDLMSALSKFYTVSLEKGKEEYGEDFANADLIAAHHASQKFCFVNMQFLNAYTAFNLWAERSIQMIDPSVSLPYWDYTADAADRGTNWPESEIFTEDWFGNAYNDHEILTFREEQLQSLHNKRSKFVHEKIDPSHNPYGFISSTFNYEHSGYVTRTASLCGMNSELDLSTCSTLISCFDDNESLEGWIGCMENGAFHGMIGGGFDCKTGSLEDFAHENEEISRGLISFALGYVITETWPENSWLSEYNHCDESCDAGDEDCGCHCREDPYEVEDEDIISFMAQIMEVLSTWPNGDKYVYGNDTNGFGFMQDGEPLSSETQLSLMRKMLEVGCEPSSVGSMAGAAAPADPIFYMLHGLMEKAYHVLRLSPSYNEKYNFEWQDYTCGEGISGAALHESLPFTERYLGFGEGSEWMTNEELNDRLSPQMELGGGLPYVYDRFRSWGNCDGWHFEYGCSTINDF